MNVDEELIEVASLSKADAQILGVSCSDALRISSAANLASGLPAALATFVLQVVVRPNFQATGEEQNGNRKSIPNVVVSPLMCELMSTALSMSIFESGLPTSKKNDGHDIPQSCVTVKISPLAVPNSLAMFSENLLEAAENLHWTAQRIDMVKELPQGSSVRLNLLYIEDRLQQFCEEREHFSESLQSILSSFLGGRVLMAGTTTAIHTEEGLAIAIVQQIQETTLGARLTTPSTDVTYRLGLFVDYKLHVEYENIRPNSVKNESKDNEHRSGAIEWQLECPGYEDLVRSLIQLAGMRGAAAPSGILLTGSPQVGKTHLSSCVAHHLSLASAAVHWVSVQDLLLHATWAEEADLLAILRPPDRLSPDQAQVLILDDLHVFETVESSLGEDSVSITVDQEMLVVKNAVVQMIDEMASRQADGNTGAAVLGIAQSSSGLPFGFVKSGRLEKEVAMLPPTESQREMILCSLIPTLGAEGHAGDRSLSEKWAEALTSVTVGCVAGDLRRILSGAWTRALAHGAGDEMDVSQAELSWDDLEKAAHTYIPMQLQTVDVCKPKYSLPQNAVEDGNLTFSNDMQGWAAIHKVSWESFGGYPLVKKRLLRTVVGPWKRFLQSLDHNSKPSASLAGLAPPPGVLFHGESGTGKSLAAECLASSLGLPMIKVKAADVMDKWLGGSEAIIRSLFAKARSAAPCILFFDELDSVATNRASRDEGGAEVMARLLSTLLNEMDGISSDRRRQSILVIACTNRLKDLGKDVSECLLLVVLVAHHAVNIKDAALLRPGRLEEHIKLEHPNSSDIRDILYVHLSQVPVSHQIDLHSLAQNLAEQNASGADVEGLCHRACLCAAHRASTTSEARLLPEDIHRALHPSS